MGVAKARAVAGQPPDPNDSAVRRGLAFGLGLERKRRNSTRNAVVAQENSGDGGWVAWAGSKGSEAV